MSRYIEILASTDAELKRKSDQLVDRSNEPYLLKKMSKEKVERMYQRLAEIRQRSKDIDKEFGIKEEKTWDQQFAEDICAKATELGVEATVSRGLSSVAIDFNGAHVDIVICVRGLTVGERGSGSFHLRMRQADYDKYDWFREVYAKNPTPVEFV